MNKTRHKKGSKVTALTPLSKRQEAAILAILETGTIQEAARTVRVSRSTLYFWLRKPSFRDRLAAARGEFFREALEIVKGGMTAAANCLVSLLGVKDEATRRLAATTILSLGLRVHEAVEIEERLRRLERIVEEGGRFRR